MSYAQLINYAQTEVNDNLFGIKFSSDAPLINNGNTLSYTTEYMYNDSNQQQELPKLYLNNKAS